MRALLSSLKSPLLATAFFSFSINILLLIPAVFMLQVFDRVLVSRSIDTLLVLSVGAAVGMLLLFLLDYVRARMQAVAGEVVSDALSPAVARAMIARAAEGEQPGEVEGLRDVASVRTVLAAQGLLALFDAPWMAVYVALIWLAHPYLGMTALAAALLMLAFVFLNDLLTRKNIESFQSGVANATRYLENSLGNAEVVQALGMGGALVERWRQTSSKLYALQAPTAARNQLMTSLARTLRQSVQIAMLGVGAWLVITSRASPGVTIACTVLLARALAPVEQLVASWRALAEARGAFARLSRMLDAKCQRADPMPLPAPAGKLSAHQLVLREPSGDRLLIAGVSVQLEPGESLAIIGPSGSGKSTLLRLLAGVWQPTAGVVRLDGSDLAQWPREQLGPWIGYVPQDVELFAGTIAENIARLGPIDPGKVVEAARRAHVHELIQSLPNGYDTAIGPHSGRLSSGQRQRIALARALYGEPSVILLDEPNSNLDSSGEAALAQALRALRGRSTVVVATHRTALVQEVDRLLVLNAGKPQHYGTVADVLQTMQAKPGPGAKVVAMPGAGGLLAQAPGA